MEVLSEIRGKSRSKTALSRLLATQISLAITPQNSTRYWDGKCSDRTPGSPRPAHCVNAGGDHWGECCVIYRRGELSKHIIDPDWPHQIALPAYRCTGANYVTIHLFCQDLTLCPRGHSLYRDGTDKAWVRRRLGQFTQSPHRYGRVAKKARSGRAPWLS